MPSSAGPVQITTATPFSATANTPKFSPGPAFPTAATAAATAASATTSAKLFPFNRQHPTSPTTTSPTASSFSTGANTKRRFPRMFGGDAVEAVPPPADSRERVKAFLMGLQDKICEGLSEVDGGSFEEESWERPEGGGGRSRVLMGGEVFEQAGVNFSEVQGSVLPPSILDQHPEAAGHPWFATGVSLVIHPRNPYIPTVHLNYRYFEAGPAWWFGGGADLTPYYPFLSDVRDWHSNIKEACDSVDENYYPVFNKWCDEYFYLKHRKETRGVGGIFYDYQDHKGKLYSGLQEDGPGAAVDAQVGKAEHDWEKLFKLHQACGGSFLPSYLPIVNKRHPTPYGEKERDFQLYRRGRYVEFNLVFDRGTIFGLQTNGRTESILMSLPPLVRWQYGYTPPPNSREALLFEDFLQPRDWHGDKQLEEKCESLGALA